MQSLNSEREILRVFESWEHRNLDSGIMAYAAYTNYRIRCFCSNWRLPNEIDKADSVPTWPRLLDFVNTLEVLQNEGIVQIVTLSNYPYVSRGTLTLEERRSIDDHAESFGVKAFADRQEAMASYAYSREHNHPLVTECFPLHMTTGPSTSSRQMCDILARSAICQLALPGVEPAQVDDLLEARSSLRDELLEFRAGILRLTWLLHQQIRNKNDLDEIRQEADVLVDTEIKAALMSLENRMRKHKDKRIRQMLFGTGRVLVDAAKLFLPGGIQEKLMAGGKSLLQLATEIDSVKPPEDQIAIYLYKLKKGLKHEG
jgi:hypothetical protein